MPGARQFDESQVLTAMMRVFWEKGYEATTIDDLVRATGLQRGSLYNAFGDKAAMFCKALRLYKDEVLADRVHSLRGDDPKTALTRFFKDIVGAARDPQRPRGCMIEAARRCCDRLPEAAAAEARSETAVIETALFELFERGKAAGRLRPGADSRTLARFYAVLARGLGAEGDPEPLEDIARLGLDMLDAA